MKLKDKKILITGADGFIGSHLTEILISKASALKALVQYNSFNSWGWLDHSHIVKDVEIVAGDIRDPNFCKNLCANCDIIFHLAALISIPYSYITPQSFIETNINGTSNICQAAVDCNCERLIHTSTSEVYGSALYVPIDEKHPLQAQSPYSASKIGADAIAMSFHKCFDLPLIIARPFNTYGPRQSARAVIPTIITQILDKSQEINLGDLTPTRDFNYVDDTCNSFIALAECEEALGEIVNIGSNSEISIGQLAERIAVLMGSTTEIVKDNNRLRPIKSEVNRLSCDNTGSVIRLTCNYINQDFTMYESVIEYIRSLYRDKDQIPLHEPVFDEREKEYVLSAINSTFVSTIGRFVEQLEDMLKNITGMCHAVATVNGTAALHIALIVSGVKRHNEVITQPLSFVATANAISYCGAQPVFVDVEKATLGMDPDALEYFLTNHCKTTGSDCYDKLTNKKIAACVPMHTFGHPCRIEKIVELCNRFNIPVVEDAAEALGSTYYGRSAGTIGKAGIYSFNGNKTVTSGGGGAIVTNDFQLAAYARHLTTTAKLPHPYSYDHDEIGYNYKMPNINAALACAQLEKLHSYIRIKRKLAEQYGRFFENREETFFWEPSNALSNYWLNTILLKNCKERNRFLEETNHSGILTRPAWNLINEMEPYKNCRAENVVNAKWLVDRIANLPSSVNLCNPK